MIFFGSHGAGKTTLAKYLGQIIYGLSEEDIEKSILRGHPQLTEEKILGNLNIKQLLNKDSGDKVDVNWREFILSPWKIIDEINRMSSSGQNIILSLMAEGRVKYYDTFYDCGNYTLFATMNPRDAGNIELPLPFLDRFGIAVPINIPDIITLRSIGLKDKKAFYSPIKIKGIMKDNRIPLWKEICRHHVNSDAMLFIDHIMSDFKNCIRVDKENSTDLNVNRGLCTFNSRCHYKESGYICNKVQTPLGVRVKEDLVRYSKALSWYLGDKEVKKEHISAIAPYIIGVPGSF